MWPHVTQHLLMIGRMLLVVLFVPDDNEDAFAPPLQCTFVVETSEVSLQ